MYIDRKNNDDDSLLSKNLSIAQYAVGDVSDDPIDIEISRRNTLTKINSIVIQDDGVSVLTEQHRFRVHAHLDGKSRMTQQVPILSMHGNKTLWVRNRQQRRKLTLFCVTALVHVRDSRMDDLSAAPREPVHHLCN